MLKKFLSLSVLSMILICGCGNDKTMQDKIAAWKEATIFMQENNLAGTASIHSGGDGNVYQKMAFGIDTGISFNATVQFNSGMSPTSQPARHEEYPND